MTHERAFTRQGMIDRDLRPAALDLRRLFFRTGRLRSAVDGSRAFADRILGKFRHTLDAKLLRYPPPVHFDGLYARVELESNFLCGSAFSDEMNLAELVAVFCLSDGHVVRLGCSG